MSKNENYELDIGEEGLDYDILDKSYNAFTQQNLLKSGLKKGMKVLDVGCGSGVMTAWIAEQIGPSGSVFAIDNSAQQLQVTQKRLENHKIKNVRTKVLSAYEVDSLKEKFDAVYCRFVLHHLHSPRKAIRGYFDILDTGGYYFAHEGVISSMFAYPDTFAWRGYLPELVPPREEQDGLSRDGDFGMKLFYECQQAGFSITDCQFHQPILWTHAQKEGLLDGLIAYKNTEIANGMSEDEWQKKYCETERLIKDESQLIGFYGSCFVAAKK